MAFIFYGRKEILFGLCRLNLAVLAAVLVFFAMAAAAKKTFDFDTGAYHLQAVNWIYESRIVKGLANLEGKLGFNSLWFVLGATLKALRPEGRISLLNLLMVYFFAAAVWASFRRIFEKKAGLADFFMALCAIPLAYEGIGKHHLIGLSTDLPVTFLTLYLTGLWIRSFEEPENVFARACFLPLAAFALTLKVSAFPVFAGSLLIFWLNKSSRLPHIKRIFSFGILLSGLWMARGVMLSGCPVYPLEFGCVQSLDWSVPQTLLQGETEVIAKWARLPSQVDETRATKAWSFLPAGKPEEMVRDWRWLKPWLVRMAEEPGARAAGFLFLAGFLTLAALRKLRGVLRESSFAVPFALSAGGILFWFLTAPDPRFGYGSLFSVGILPAAAALRRMKGFWAPRLTALVGIWFLKGFVVLLVSGVSHGSKALSWKDAPAYPTAVTTGVKTLEGYPLNVAGAFQCWEAPLPCVPSPRPDLKVKVSPSGFPEMFWYDREFKARAKDLD